jgi:serine/threonine-protein kinase
VLGRRLGHYVVLTQLGRGGMGDVYVAQDTRLDRRVALKVAHRSAAIDSDARLQQEARAAAALNHPNIVHLYSVEEADGLVFITMELVPGRTLHEILGGGAPLPLARTLGFAGEIAEALACAHAAGIVHRDLKPGNVMITADDRVKVLDFGVAKLLKPTSPWQTAATTTTVTAETASGAGAVGTIGYMSPEQALGRPVDGRTDLFALGVMVFEMATGRSPFPGETPAIVFDHLLNRPSQSPLTLNPELPPSLAALIDKSLEKDPGRRYASAGAFLEDLRRIDPAHTRGGLRSPSLPSFPSFPPGADATASSIVVLPFLDISPAKDQEYFCHGITEEIISQLTRVPGLRVMSRTSAFAFYGKDVEITEIGRRLGVGAALEGSVRKAGSRVRIAAQLVNARDGYQVWSKRFDRELSDVFAIQDEIAASVVSEFRMAPPGGLDDRGSPGILAHDSYLKGMYALHKWNADSVPQAIAAFRAAIAENSSFAPAYASLAEAQIWLYSSLGVLPARDTVPEARWAVDTALELDPALADAHRIRALIAMNHDWDRDESGRALARALELAPGSAAAHFWNGWRLALLEQRYEEAFVELAEAERLDPLDLQLKTQIGYVHHFHHDVGQAIERFEKVLALEPSFAFAHYALGDALMQKGEYEDAISAYHRSIELSGRSVNHIGVLGYAYGRSGRDERAREQLDELKSRAAHGYVSGMWFALVHLGLGDADEAFRWLDRAYEERDGSLILITAAVEFDPQRGDPRFKSLLERMGVAS